MLPIAFTTDATVVQFETTKQAAHLTELRSRIDAVRGRYGLSGFTWTYTMTAGATPIRALHISELRTALLQVYSNAGIPPPTFTDASLSGGPIKVVHINELRSALQAIE